MRFRVVLPIFTADGGHLGVYIHFWGSDFDRLSFTICLVGQKTVISLSSIFLGGEVVYRPVYIVVLTLWRPSWTPSWILEKAPAGITGSFSMLFLMVFGRFPEKFSLGIFFSPSKPNTIRLLQSEFFYWALNNSRGRCIWYLGIWRGGGLYYFDWNVCYPAIDKAIFRVVHKIITQGYLKNADGVHTSFSKKSVFNK